MKAKLYASALLLVLCACLGIIVYLRAQSGSGTAEQPPNETEAERSGEPESPAPLPAGRPDSEISFTALGADGSVSVCTMDEYLPGAVAGEMPASFDIEALKAQAAAARTYILYKISHETPAHPQADVCCNPSCCKAELSQAQMLAAWGGAYEEYRAKIDMAVSATDGQYLTYDGEPIQAVFHSSSDGMTAASGEIWSDEPYLVCVSSPEGEEDVPNFISTVTSSVEGFSEAILAERPLADLSGAPSSWIGQMKLTESGRVSSVEIGGETVGAGELRSIFGLRSTAFTLEYTDGEFVFTVRGFGHGVGMSQYGANVLAAQGLDYREILAHYYPETELVCAG